MVFGWFENKPKLKVGDTVWDYYFARIGKPREKATIVKIVREGVFAQEKYFIRTPFGYESGYSRKRSELELIESAPEKPKAIDLRHQEPDTFKVFAKKEYRTGFGNIPKDAAARAAKKNSDGYVVYFNGMQCHMPSSDFHDGFEDVGQHEMRRRIEAKMRAERELARIRAIRNTPQEPQRSDWFDVIAKKDNLYMSGEGAVLEVKEGAMTRMRALSDGTYEVETAGVHIRLNEASATKDYEKYDINDYATEYPRKKEAKDVGGELYGYPPEDNDEGYATALRKLEVAAKREQELAAKVAELEKKNEVARREQVAEEYGIVAERHLWSILVGKPERWGKAFVRGYTEEKSEVLTEGRNMVEAAMAAEAMAKGIDEDANVLSIDYVRVIGAIKK